MHVEEGGGREPGTLDLQMFRSHTAAVPAVKRGQIRARQELLSYSGSTVPHALTHKREFVKLIVRNLPTRNRKALSTQNLFLKYSNHVRAKHYERYAACHELSTEKMNSQRSRSGSSCLANARVFACKGDVIYLHEPRPCKRQD